MLRRTSVLLLTVLLTSVAALQAADFWEKKDYKEWSLKECQKMLQKSPWARERVYSQVFIDPLQTPSLDTSSTDITRGPGGREREANPRIVYLAQIRSAFPVRQALVRIGMLQSKYDDMTPDQKAEFDARAAQFLGADFPDQVLIHVSFESVVHQDQLNLVQYWRTQTTETLRNNVFLYGRKGVKVPLATFQIADKSGQSFLFTFPKQVEGEPLVTKEDKRVQLEFIHPNIRNQGEQRVLLEFKIKDMIVNGTLRY